ncbi:MAG: hypothetical protein AAF843_17205 [Bacteroidota bacterium]
MKNIFLSALLVLSFTSCAQEQNENIERINSFIEDNIEISSSQFAIYFLRDKYIVITQSGDALIVNYLSEKSGFESSEPYKGEILQTLFTKKFLGSTFQVVYMDDQFKSSCVGSLMYFSVYDSDRVVSEFLLPSILLCDAQEVDYPISNELLTELYKLVDSRWAKK